MKTKNKNVRINGLKQELKKALIEVAIICKQFSGEKYEVTITSGNDGKHMKNSKHYTDEAVDIRTKDMINPKNTWLIIKQKLKNCDVIWEEDHIHIELK